MERVNAMLAKKVREAREHSGLTTIELAGLLRLSQRAVFYYEVGERRPSIEILCRMCVFCQVPLAHFFVEIDERREEIAREG